MLELSKGLAFCANETERGRGEVRMGGGRCWAVPTFFRPSRASSSLPSHFRLVTHPAFPTRPTCHAGSPPPLPPRSPLPLKTVVSSFILTGRPAACFLGPPPPTQTIVFLLTSQKAHLRPASLAPQTSAASRPPPHSHRATAAAARAAVKRLTVKKPTVKGWTVTSLAVKRPTVKRRRGAAV